MEGLKMKRTIKLSIIFLVVWATMAGWPPGEVKAEKISNDLEKLTLEELMSIKITSVSKKEEKLSKSPAAIYVITQEDIRRSGVTSIPEALRMAPGLEVAHLDANKWAIASRGFNSRFASKLLFLIDGRTVYSPVFSGVYWDVQDTMMEDIERIEVIRGPGATLWGANAVSGIINIITKKAKDTQGGLITAGGGSEERGFGGVRYGGKLGEAAYFRVFAKYFNRDDFVDASGTAGADDWDAARGGFRMDWDISKGDNLTLQGDYYDGGSGQSLTRSTSLTAPYTETSYDEVQVDGANILGRWNHVFSGGSDMTLQLYFDHARRENVTYSQNINVFDLDFQHTFAWGDRQEIIWGMGYRLISNKFKDTFTLSFDPLDQTDHIVNMFVQDDITLIEDLVQLSVGSKFEFNSFTGFEFQPGARILWTPHQHHSLWASISRAVRTPSIIEDSSHLNAAVFPGGRGSTILMSLMGNPDFESENLLSYELGYRLQPVDTVYLDFATFFHDYKNLQSLEEGSPYFESTPSPPHLVLPLQFDNKMSGETYGVEMAATWDIFDFWKVNAGFTWFRMHLHLDPSSKDTTLEATEGHSPEYRWHIRSYLDLPYNLEFDAALYFVDNLESLNITSYTRLDLRLGWNPLKNVEVSLALQNLLDSQHQEFNATGGIAPTEVQRSVYGKVTWRF